MMSSRKKRLLNTFALVAILVALGAGIVGYQRRQFTGLRGVQTFEEKMYLPDSKKLEIASLGFKNLYADLLWLRAIQAFGGAWDKHGDMNPIFHYFDVVTDLDPKFIEAYKLGNLVIGDEGGNYQKSLDILRKGMWRNPNNWDLPYLGIYNAVWQMKDLKQGRWFAYMAARVPGRPEFVARMREYIERRTGRYDVAYRMNLQYMLRYLDQGESLQAKLTSIRFWDILDRWYEEKLVEAARRFIAENGRDPKTMAELISSKAWKPFKAPTMESLRDTIDGYRKRGEPLQPHFDAIAKQAEVEIKGDPPEPNGYSYRIIHDEVRPTTGSMKVTAANAFKLPERHFGYIINESRIVTMLRNYVVGLSEEIQSFQSQHGRWPKSMEELVKGRFNYNDPLGGKFTYDPKTGQFKDSSLEGKLRRRKDIYID